jgi:hypothetical protein
VEDFFLSDLLPLEERGRFDGHEKVVHSPTFLYDNDICVDFNDNDGDDRHHHHQPILQMMKQIDSW